MKIRIEIILGAIAIIIAFLAWQFPQDKINLTTNTQYSIPSSYSDTKINISGANVTVTVKQSTSGVPLKEGAFSGANTSNTVYLPKGQKLTVKVTGSGVNLNIHNSIAEFVNIINTGAGLNISEI